MTDKDFYEHTRKQIEHEDQLLNHRMTWLLMIQGLLFSAYGFTISAEATAVAGQHFMEFKPQLDNIRFWLAITGVVSSVTLYVGIIAASLSMRALKKSWEIRKVDKRSLFPQLLGGEFIGMLGGLVPVLMIPIVFPLSWYCLTRTQEVLWIVGISTSLAFVYVVGLFQGHARALRLAREQAKP